MSTSINGTGLRNISNLNKPAATPSQASSTPVTTGKSTAPVDSFASNPANTKARAHIEKQLKAGLELTVDLQGLSAALAKFQPETKGDVNLLKAAFQAVDAFKPEDGAQLNTREHLLETLGRTLMRNLSKFDLNGVNDLNVLTKVVTRFTAEDGSDLNSLKYAQEKVSKFEPQDGAELNTAAGLEKLLKSKLPADANAQIAGLVKGGLRTSQDLFTLTNLLGEFTLEKASDVDVLKSAWLKASKFEPQDGADLNAKGGALEALTRTFAYAAGSFRLENTQDLQILADVLKRFTPEDGSGINALETFQSSVKRFTPEDGAQLNLKELLLGMITSKMPYV